MKSGKNPPIWPSSSDNSSSTQFTNASSDPSEKSEKKPHHPSPSPSIGSIRSSLNTPGSSMGSVDFGSSSLSDYPSDTSSDVFDDRSSMDFITRMLHDMSTRPPREAKKAKDDLARKYYSDKMKKEEELRNIRPRYTHLPEIIKLPIFIHLILRIAILWEIFIYCITIVSVFFVTYSSLFSFYDGWIWDIILITDLIFFFDCYARIITEHWRARNRCQCLVFFVPYTFTQIICDLVSLFPLERFWIAVSGAHQLDEIQKVDYCRLNRVIRLRRIFVFLKRLVAERKAQEQFIFVIKFTTLYVCVIHFFACFLFLITEVAPIDFLLHRYLESLSTTWLRDIPILNDSFAYYAYSLSFSTSTVTTVGYGDLVPENEGEMLACLIVMLIGAILLSGQFSSTITSFLIEVDGVRFDLFYRLEGILVHLKMISAIDIFSAKVDQYYRLLWNYREGVHQVPLFKILPRSMQEDIYVDICQEMFQKSSLFRGLEQSFLRGVAQEVEIVLYNPDMIICELGMFSNAMFYIIQGELRAMSKDGKISAIIRAGNSIGEVNLFFSYPYTIQFETKTCCQIIVLKKDRMLRLFQSYPKSVAVIRSRLVKRLRRLGKFYRLCGNKPLMWVEPRRFLFVKGRRVDAESPVILRWGNLFNRKCPINVYDNIEDTHVIIDYVCLIDSVKKDHTIPYSTCKIPPIFFAENWILLWNLGIMALVLIFSFTGPYCLAFSQSSEWEEYFCELNSSLVVMVLISALFIIDVFVEICTATSCSGLYYRFNDGLRVKYYSYSLWIDILAALPFHIFATSGEQKFFNYFPVILACLKLYKIIRYLHYQENINPQKIFLYRFIETVFVLLYGIHFIACINFITTCPIRTDQNSTGDLQIVQCERNIWLSSYFQAATRKDNDLEIDFHEVEKTRPERLKDTIPYLLSFYYATATLTSAGFGDFYPQRSFEKMWSVLFQLIGFFIINYYNSALTSALSCTIRPQLALFQRISQAKQFMIQHGLSDGLQRRVIEHCTLMDNLRMGITLPHNVNHLLYDTPAYLEEDTLFLEAWQILEGVPIFTKTDQKLIINLARKMKRYMVPPGCFFIQKGEVRREMYIIGKGCVQILKTVKKSRAMLESSAYFGLRDLLFGEPSPYYVKTLSHCILYSIDIASYESVYAHEKDVESRKRLVAAETERIKPVIDVKIRLYAEEMFKTKLLHGSHIVYSWNHFPTRKDEIIKGVTYREYTRSFNKLGKFKFLSFLFMPRTVNPQGQFAKIWTCFMSIVSTLVLFTIVVESFLWIRSTWFFIIQFLLNLINIVDIYLKMHWGYYSTQNIRIDHPVQTCIHYIFEGSFVYDVFFATQFEFLTFFFGWTSFLGYGDGSTWSTVFSYSRAGQVLRIPFLFIICHNEFEGRNAVLVSMYVWFTVVACSLISAYALNLACPWGRNIWEEGDENRKPECLAGTWIEKKLEQNATEESLNRWISGIYYVSQVILVIGFGDMTTLRVPELFLQIFMMIFGFLITRCIIADITAAEVEPGELKTRLIENLKTLRMILALELIEEKMFKNIYHHCSNTWYKTKGLNSHDIFYDMHPALNAEIYRKLLGDKLRNAPIFRQLEENMLRAICQEMEIVYYLRGERIIRAGNHFFDMYIITEGKIWICNQGLEHVCTLGPLESFGEWGLMHKTPRFHNAVAATNVQLYMLTASDFEKILILYPKMYRLIKSSLKIEGHDLYMRRVELNEELKKILPWKVAHSMAKKEVWKTTMIMHLLSIKEPNLDNEKRAKLVIEQSYLQKLRRKFVGWGPEDDRLPFLYFVKIRKGKRDHYICPKFPQIHPNCGFSKKLFFISIYLCYITPAFALYEYAYTYVNAEDPRHDVSLVVHYISIVFECIMYLSIILKFLTPYKLPEGLYCKDTKRIASKYVYSLEFWVDIISSFPIQYFPTEFIIKHRKFFILRCLRLINFYREQFSLKDDLGITTFRYKLMISVSWFCLMAHILACIFYTLAPCDKKLDLSLGDEKLIVCPNNTWTYAYMEAKRNNKAADNAPWKFWMRSLYWVVTIISTTGYGDITAQNTDEMLLASGCFFCGAFILSIILSNFTSGFGSRNKAKRTYLYNVNLLTTHLKILGISEQRNASVLNHFLLLWKRSRGQTYDEAIAFLPKSFQIDVAYALFMPVLIRTHLIGKVPGKVFLRQLAFRLKHRLYLPGTTIVNKGEQGDELYIVYSGKIIGFNGDNIENIYIKKVYAAGDIFGRSAVFFFNSQYAKNYRAEEISEVLVLKQLDLLYLTHHFPDFDFVCQVEAIKRYDPFVVSRSIFITNPETTPADEGQLHFRDKVSERMRELLIPGVINEGLFGDRRTSNVL